MHPLQPDVLYQQNHCGIYRLQRPARTWERIGRNMPADTGDIGFVMGLHPRDADTCWVFPMDGTDVWPRTSPDGRPALFVTQDAGNSWQCQNQGLPQRGWFTVKRQALSIDNDTPTGIYFGTTSGDTLDQLLQDLDRQFPGIRFRMINEQDEMRPNIAFFVRGEKTFNLEEPLSGGDKVVIMQALAGG